MVLCFIDMMNASTYRLICWALLRSYPRGYSALIDVDLSVALSLKPHEFPTVEMVEIIVHEVRMKRTSNMYQSRAMRWPTVKQASDKKLTN